MNKIKILDCTLRDGGYVNKWKFGKDAVKGICERNEKTGIDIIELGFLRDVVRDENTAVFSSTDQLREVIEKKNKDVKYAIMTEMACYYPFEKLALRDESAFDMVRYTFWKRCLDEGFEYCKKIKERGYELAVQPTRVEQYSTDDFAKMLLHFGELEPYAIYIVDTFGLLSKEMLVKYAEIADRYLDKNIALGYHAHNNMQQAFMNAVALIELDLDREIVVDVSAFGMGRGAGNLNSEIFLSYLNQCKKTIFDIKYIYEIWDLWLKEIYKMSPWGYSLYYYISAYYKANPNYAAYLEKNNFSVAEAERILQIIPYEERIIFSEETIKKYINSWR